MASKNSCFLSQALMRQLFYAVYIEKQTFLLEKQRMTTRVCDKKKRNLSKYLAV